MHQFLILYGWISTKWFLKVLFSPPIHTWQAPLASSLTCLLLIARAWPSYKQCERVVRKWQLKHESDCGCDVECSKQRVWISVSVSALQSSCIAAGLQRVCEPGEVVSHACVLLVYCVCGDTHLAMTKHYTHTTHIRAYYAVDLTICVQENSPSLFCKLTPINTLYGQNLELFEAVNISWFWMRYYDYMTLYTWVVNCGSCNGKHSWIRALGQGFYSRRNEVCLLISVLQSAMWLIQPLVQSVLGSLADGS
jgi:hypothetical protein